MKTNKIIGGLLAVTMLVSPMMPAVSMLQASAADADAMRTVLGTVKSRIDIPEELSKFSSNTYGREDNLSYSFSWQNEEGDSSISVDCDDKGRISNYYANYDKMYDYRQKLPKVSKDDAQKLAEEFLKKAAPETAADKNDVLAVSDVWSSGLSYNVSFEREVSGVKVKNDFARVNVNFADDSLYVTSMSLNYNYDAEFEEAAGEKISDAEAAYADKFPAELVYKKQYNAILLKDEKGKENDIRLIYRIKDSNAGYISAFTGEIVEEDTEEMLNRYATMDAAVPEAEAGGMSSMKSVFTQRELDELDTVSGLYSADEAEKYLKNITELKIDSSYKVSDSGITTFVGDGDDKTYILRVGLNSKNEKKNSVNARFEAEKKRLISLYNYNYRADDDDKELTDKEKQAGEKQIDKFLNTVIADKLPEFAEIKCDAYNSTVSKTYVHNVNDIPYINDTINVSYDTHDNKITSYRVEYDDDAEFVSTDNALNADDAYKYMTKISPVIEKYVYSGGKYRLVYTMENAPEINAFTGEDINKDIEKIRKTEYTDISSHWCKEAVNALVDFGIALEGDEFMPDTDITQAELLRVLVSGIDSRYYITEDNDSIYSRCYQSGVLNKSERDDDAPVKREEAFVYMIRLAGYDDVAKLSDIYNVRYADGSELSEGLIGYAAILSGMGIVGGDGGRLRPQDNITRAEAISMLYKYMQ